MKLSPREATLALATGVVALFGLSSVLARPVVQRWKDLRREREQWGAEIAVATRLLADRERYAEEAETLSARIPVYPADKKMDVHWLQVMDQLASQTGVRINRRQVGAERRWGPMYELPIECHDWEASQENLVRFLYEAQFGPALLDVRHLYVMAKQGHTVRGRFSLYCAYVKSETTGRAEDAAPRSPP